MDLVTEYYQRNAVQTPLIRYAQNANLILRKKNSCYIEGKYDIVSIVFTNKDGMPGSFQFSTYQPCYNSLRTSRVMACHEDHRVVWDEYEDYIHKLVADYKGKVVPLVEKDELTLACWEIILFSCDSTLAELPMSYLEILYSVMNYSLTTAERLDYANSFMTCLRNSGDPNMAPHIKLLNNGLSMCQSYMDFCAHWLAKLLSN